MSNSDSNHCKHFTALNLVANGGYGLFLAATTSYLYAKSRAGIDSLAAGGVAATSLITSTALIHKGCTRVGLVLSSVTNALLASILGWKWYKNRAQKTGIFAIISSITFGLNFMAMVAVAFPHKKSIMK